MLEQKDFQKIEKIVESGFRGADKRTDKKIDSLAIIIEKGFQGAKKDTDKQFARVDKQFARVDKQFARVDKRLTKVEATMVTKEYLDDKLADLRGDIIVWFRKDERRFLYLVEILRQKKVLSDKEVEIISDIKVLAQPAGK